MNHTSRKGPWPLHAARPQAGPGSPEGLGRPASDGVFLHTSWRSSGTWLWSRCREQPSVRAFYEPLHETIGGLRRADIAKLQPGAWHSRHGETAPYFADSGPWLARRRAGVPLYQPHFAYDGFFLNPGESDPALEAYLRGLLASAATPGQDGARVAVLKFCRSLGRVGWMERHFPEMLHAVVLRDPLDQWRSGRRLLTEERNRYFTVAPLLVLARNPGHALVRQACLALDVRLPVLGSTDMSYGLETVWRHVRHQDTATQYRGFLAYWTATAVAALHSRALLIDTAELARSPEHRAEVEAAFAARLGGPIDLTYRAVAGTDLAGPSARDLSQAHADAAAFVRAEGAGLAPGRLAQRAELLAAHGDPAAEPRRHSVQVAAWPQFPQARIRRSGWRHARMAGEVAYARTLHALRRLHGKLTRRAG